jgi:hypothetical protein
MGMSHRLLPVWIPSLIILWLAGCSSEPVGSAPGDGDASNDLSATTWYRDVLPVAQEHCLGCHNDDAPTFSMERWSAELAQRAPLIAQYTAAGIMPPWKPSSDCNSYHGERLLQDDEIEIFAAWADAAGAEGDPEDAPPPPADPPGLARVDVSVGMADAYTPTPPEGDVNDLHCFVMDPELDEDAVLTGYDLHPGEPAVVHHALLYAASAAELDALDAEDPSLGYACGGGPRAPSAQVIAGWVPGMPANTYPEGTGVPLASDTKLVMQIHYNTAQSGPLPDQTMVDLQLAETDVDARAQLMSVADTQFAIPPHTQGYTTTVEVSVPVSGTLWATAPHMHLLGRQARVDVLRANGDTACLIDIPDWDFDWQQFYFLSSAQGLSVQPGDTLRFSCTWDNDTDQTVTWGDGTEDEMCITYLYATGD